jgi:16S rRNA pseudouridine516 synthase
VSKAGLISRSDAKVYIRSGRVSVDGVIVRSAAEKFPENSIILLDSEKIIYEKNVYYMMNKPKGIVSASEDKKEKTVVDLIAEKGNRNLFPAGRLDKDTTGFVLITDDGDFAHKILSPNRHIEKEYIVETDLPIENELVEFFKIGIDLGDFTSLPATLEILEAKKAAVVLKEGKYHQIKRMFLKFGLTVTSLKRIRMGELFLDENLKEGEYKKLTPGDVSKIAQRE